MFWECGDRFPTRRESHGVKEREVLFEEFRTSRFAAEGKFGGGP